MSNKKEWSVVISTWHKIAILRFFYLQREPADIQKFFDELRREYGSRTMAKSSAYVVLSRIKNLGYLEEVGKINPTPTGGRPSALYVITQSGRERLKELQKMFLPLLEFK